jgi:hypothetical protein
MHPSGTMYDRETLNNTNQMFWSLVQNGASISYWLAPKLIFNQTCGMSDRT